MFRLFFYSINNSQAALDQLTFSPSPDYHGPAALGLVLRDARDAGCGLLGRLLVPIDVEAANDPPTITSPPALQVQKTRELVASFCSRN